MSFSVSKEREAPELTIASAGFRCEKCVEEAGVALRNIETHFTFKWADEENMFERFLTFILDIVSDWWGAEIGQVSSTEPLASICVAVPSSTQDNVKSLLYRRSYLSSGKRRTPLDVDTGYDVYDILTEEHFQDALHLASSLKGQVKFWFKTANYITPTICYRHHGALHRHVHNWKRKGLALLLKVKAAISLSALTQRAAINCQSLFSQLFSLPEVNSLMDTGLYSPVYIQREISEMDTSVIDSIVRGFQELKL